MLAGEVHQTVLCIVTAGRTKEEDERIQKWEVEEEVGGWEIREENSTAALVHMHTRSPLVCRKHM